MSDTETVEATISKTSSPIFKKDSKGRWRVWYYEVDEANGRWRSVAGLEGGSLVTSGWTTCEPKSKDTPAEQALFEAGAEEVKKLKRVYRRTKQEVEAAESGEGDMMFKVMLAKTIDQASGFLKKLGDKAADTSVYTQPKFDGMRAVITAKGTFSREGERIITAPHIEEALKPLFEAYPSVVIDGELYNHAYKHDFQTLMSILRKQKAENVTEEEWAQIRETAKLYNYDAFFPEEPKLTFIERMVKLNKTFSEVYGEDPRATADTEEAKDSSFPVFSVPTLVGKSLQWVVDQAHEIATAYRGRGYEGGIARLDLPYKHSKCHHLLKLKIRLDAEFEILDIIEGNGSWAGAAKALIVKLDNGKECEVGMRGTMENNRDMFEHKDEWIGGHAKVQYDSLTNDGLLRQGVAIDCWKGRRND